MTKEEIVRNIVKRLSIDVTFGTVGNKNESKRYFADLTTGIVDEQNIISSKLYPTMEEACEKLLDTIQEITSPDLLERLRDAGIWIDETNEMLDGEL